MSGYCVENTRVTQVMTVTENCVLHRHLHASHHNYIVCVHNLSWAPVHNVIIIIHNASVIVQHTSW